MKFQCRLAVVIATCFLIEIPMLAVAKEVSTEKEKFICEIGSTKETVMLKVQDLGKDEDRMKLCYATCTVKGKSGNSLQVKMQGFQGLVGKGGTTLWGAPPWQGEKLKENDKLIENSESISDYWCMYKP